MFSIKTNIILTGIFLISINCCAQKTTGSSEILNKIDLVIGKIVRDTDLKFRQKIQKPADAIQSVNFNYQFGQEVNGFAYAISNMSCSEAGEFRFGISSGSKTEVWINNERVYISTNDSAWFTEYAYDMYELPSVFVAECSKGNNRILIKISSCDTWKFYLAALNENGSLNEKLRFTADPYLLNANSNWMICGPFDNKDPEINLPENNFKPFYKSQKNFISWSLPTVPVIAKVLPAENASFKKHSYNEWHYSNGCTLWSILNFSIETENQKYIDFVHKNCTFTFENFGYFRYQYYDLNEIHGYNHRLFRMHMLDDASAPALPYLKLVSMGILNDNNKVIKQVEKFLVTGQSRLADETFCRQEPWTNTIWADDLFMSAPYLMMLGETEKNQKYIDDAAFQVLSYYKYLLDTKTGLCRHGWVNSPKKDSIPYWSRANGWMIWAASEVLARLPENHKDFKAIKKLYKSHIDGMLACLDEKGFVHQIIDDKKSFRETSSTAMLTIALARGVNHNWLKPEYKKYAGITWDAVNSAIEADGNVKEICEGTSISTDVNYYLKRKTMDHDPRGLGAVITAGLEMYKMNSLN